MLFNEIVNEDNVESSTIQPIINELIEECKPEEENEIIIRRKFFSDKIEIIN